MIFLRHQCYTYIGIPRIVSAKYEVILSLATMVFLLDKIHREEEEKRKEKTNNFKEHFVLNSWGVSSGLAFHSCIKPSRYISLFVSPLG